MRRSSPLARGRPGATFTFKARFLSLVSGSATFTTAWTTSLIE